MGCRDSRTEKTQVLFALERTELAVERSVMAAERLVYSASTPGCFPDHRFLVNLLQSSQYKAEAIGAGVVSRPNAPRNLRSSSSPVKGTLSLMPAAWQHRGFLRQIGPS